MTLRVCVSISAFSPASLIGAHQFRHGLATELLRHGASIGEIGELLGHRSPALGQWQSLEISSPIQRKASGCAMTSSGFDDFALDGEILRPTFPALIFALAFGHWL